MLSKNKELVRLSDRLECKVRELESLKLRTLDEEFYDLSKVDRDDFFRQVDSLKKEVKSIKSGINNMEEKFNELKTKYNNTIHSGELWLSDVLEKERPEFGSNNLILSPVGSGKSFAIQNKLAKKGGFYQLMLVPSRHLKNSIMNNEGSLGELGENHNLFTTGNDLRFDNDNLDRIHIMTYSEFGWRIRNNDVFLIENNIQHIYCDEIHSLVEYKNYNQDEALIHAMRYLFLSHEHITIFYFTATVEHLTALKERDPEKFSSIKTFNYLKYPSIKKYTNIAEHQVAHTEQLNILLEAHTGDFIAYGYKGLAYHKTITGQKKLAGILERAGFTPLVLWSTKTESKHGEMNAEQLRALKELIKTEKIPEGYNFLVINSAMREGWDLNDEKVEIAIINTTSETDQVQARGRIRKNIATFITKVEGQVDLEQKVLVPENFMNVNLTSKDKRDLCKEVRLVTMSGGISKWPSLSKALVDQGYQITDSRITIDGKRTYVSKITKE